MSGFLAIALSFPTVFFSTLLAAAFLYWILVLIGALDLDAFDHGLDGVGDAASHGLTEGALEGGLHGLEGGLHGVEAGVHSVEAGVHSVEAGVHSVEAGVHSVEAGVHSVEAGVHSVEAGVHSVEAGVHSVEGGAHSAAEGAAHAHGGVLGAVPFLAAFLAFLRVGRVPITIVGSTLILSAWLLCFFGTLGVQKFGLWQSISWLIATGIALGAFFGGSVITSLAMRPLEPLFKSTTLHGQEHLVGQVCVVTSTRVDDRHGRAEFNDRISHLVLDVRCLRENAFARGHEAVIVGYDRAREVYLIEPLELEPQERSSFKTTAKTQGMESTSS